MWNVYALTRVAATLAGVLLLAASAHVTISKAGGYGEASSLLILAVTMGLGAGAIVLGAALAQKRQALALAILVCLICGEGFALLGSSERIVSTREAAQAPLREALARHEAAAARLAKAESAQLIETATSPRLDAANAAHATAMANVASEAAKPGCRSNCRDLLQAAVDAVAKEVEAARSELKASSDKARRDIDVEIAAARAELAANPKPASATALADRLGISATNLDLLIAALGALSVNGLASALLAFAAHGTRQEIVTPEQSSDEGVAVETAIEPVPAQEAECPVCEWLSRATARKVGARVPVGELHRAYLTWTRANGNTAISLTRFGRELERCNLAKERKSGKVFALDIELAPSKTALRVVA